MQLASLNEHDLASLDGAPLARVASFNPLALPPQDAARALPDAPLVLGWSGGLGSDLFERAFATWMPAGRAALDAYLDAAEPLLRARSSTILLRTHARHTLSDAQAALALLAQRPDAPVRLALDPASCLEPSMLADAEDHLVRTFGFAAAAADLIILASIEQPPATDDPDAPPLALAPLGSGLLDPALLGRLTREHARPGTIVAAIGHDADAQLARAALL